MIRTTRRKRPNPKRATPRVIHSERTEHITGHRRIRLKMFSAAWHKRRAEIFERAGGRCEEEIRRFVYATSGDNYYQRYRCANRATEWSHKRHGANKCDCMDCGIASCRECHARRHNPKPCPRKVREC